MEFRRVVFRSIGHEDGKWREHGQDVDEHFAAQDGQKCEGGNEHDPQEGSWSGLSSVCPLFPPVFKRKSFFDWCDSKEQRPWQPGQREGYKIVVERFLMMECLGSALNDMSAEHGIHEER